MSRAQTITFFSLILMFSIFCCA